MNCLVTSVEHLPGRTSADSGDLNWRTAGRSFWMKSVRCRWKPRPKLLRVLEDGQVDRVGSTQSIPVDVRIIAATNIDLVAAISTGRIQARLVLSPERIPDRDPATPGPTQGHSAPRPSFPGAFSVETEAAASGTSVLESMDRLVQYPWPGNVRELQNVIERAVILARSSMIEIDDQFLCLRSSLWRRQTPRIISKSWSGSISFKYSIAHMWRIYGPNGAAAQLGLNPSTLRSKLKKLGLKRPVHLASI